MEGGKWGYALENGNVGVYKKRNRLWRVKAKIRPIGLLHLFKDQKISYLVIGWQKGKIEIRNDLSGDVVFKMSLN